MHYVYILQSERIRQYYVGSTQNLENRKHEHNNGETVSTRRGIPWEIIHVEKFKTRIEAVKRERLIKARGIGRYLESINRQ